VLPLNNKSSLKVVKCYLVIVLTRTSIFQEKKNSPTANIVSSYDCYILTTYSNIIISIPLCRLEDVVVVLSLCRHLMLLQITALKTAGDLADCHPLYVRCASS